MADEKVGLDLEIKLQNAQSLKELKQVLKDARDAAIGMKEGSAEYTKFMKIAGQAKDQIGDMNERIRALDPEEKAKAFGALGHTIVGGFQAAAGTLAVFTGDNEELNKILLKTMAIVQATQGIQAIADAKKQLGTLKTILGLKSQAVAQEELNAVQGEGQAGALAKAEGGFGNLKKAIIGTGIGALVVLLGVLIANWDKISKAIVDTFPALGKLGEYIDKAKAAISGLVAGFKAAFQNIGKALADLMKGHFQQALADITNFQAVSTAMINGYNDKMEEIAQEKKDKLLAIQVEESKRKLEVLEAEGKDTYALKRKILTDELSLMKQGTEEEIKAYKDKQNEIKVLDAEHKKELLDKQKELNEKKQDLQNQQRQRDMDDAKKQHDIMLKEADDRIKLMEQEHALEKQLDDLMREGMKEGREKEKADTIAEFQDKLSHITGNSITENEIRQQLMINQREALKAIDEKYNKQEQQAAEERVRKNIDNETKLRDAKLSIAQSAVDGASALADIMGKNGKKSADAAKALALAQIGIDEARAISAMIAGAAEAAAATGPAAPFVYAGYIAAGITTTIANIAKAYQLLNATDSTTAGSGSAPSTPSAPAPVAPNLNVGRQQTLMQGRADIESQTIRAYVVEHDITDSQNRTAYLKQKAAHG